MKYFNWEIVSNTVLSLSALFLLINLTPRDLLPYFQKQKKALKELILNKNVLGSLPEGININPENSGMSIINDPETFLTLKNMARQYSQSLSEINWDNVIGVGYSILSAPVGNYKVAAFNPLYFVELPSGNSTTLILKPIGNLKDFQKWFLTEHTSSVNLVALIFLMFGFAIQLLIGLSILK